MFVNQYLIREKRGRLLATLFPIRGGSWWTSKVRVRFSSSFPPLQVAVPRSAVGVVIGKNGEMIKKIQNETGARVQFQQGRDDNPEERMCALTGTMNQIEDARQRIEELIESVLVVHWNIRVPS